MVKKGRMIKNNLRHSAQILPHVLHQQGFNFPSTASFFTAGGTDSSHYFLLWFKITLCPS